MASEHQFPLKRRRRWRSRSILALALLLGIDQSVQLTLLRDGEFMGRRVAPFDPPLFTRAQRASLQQLQALAASDDPAGRTSALDPDLGWASKRSSEGEAASIDEHGARRSSEPIPVQRRSGVRRLITLGCSFTFGMEVSDQEAWPYLIDEAREDLEVLNLACAGYGIDQALLRWERGGPDLNPDTVWIGLLPSAVLRVLTHYPALAHHWLRIVLFKPLFRLDDAGELRFQPSPARSVEQCIDLLSDQAKFLQAVGGDDPWVRRAPRAYAPRGSSWTHYFAVTRLATTWYEARGRDPASYLRDPEGELSRLLRAMILRLRDELRLRGKEMRLVVLPARGDLERVDSDGRAYWTPFVESIEARGMRTLDLSAVLIEADAVESDEFWMPGNHYSPQGNRVVAEALLEAWEPRR